MSNPPTNIEIFFSYAHKDKKLRFELEKYVMTAVYPTMIFSWHDGEIGAGKEWEREIEEHLASAQIILLLVSVDFLYSLYCSGVEMARALERHELGEARVIPIILRPVCWQNAPFAHLQVLPAGARPVTRWSDRDEAFLSVAMGIRNAVDEIAKKQLSFSVIT